MAQTPPVAPEDEMAALRRRLAELEQQLAAQQTGVQQPTLQPSGSGGAAYGSGAKAGGERSVVADQIHGNVYLGSPPQDEATAFAIYRRVYISACRQLPLRGVDIGASDPTSQQKRLDLDQVYIALDTTTRIPLEQKVPIEKSKRQREPVAEPGKERPLSALEAASRNRRLVLLGAPGSGKSTFLNHLGLCLALHGLEPNAGWLKRLPGWPKPAATLLPLTVILRDFARTMPPHAQPATPDQLWRFITSRLHTQNLDFASVLLHTALEQGDALVLLDGLDEIPTQAQRTFVRDSVAAFAARYPHSRLLVTCRTLSYQRPEERLNDFSFVEIAPFDDPKIDAFIAAWYSELARVQVVQAQEADPLSQFLQAAVRRPELQALATNPLLLTVMALVHTHKGRLSDARALLYEETVDILLWRWEAIKVAAGDDAPTLRRLLHEANRTDVDLKRTLWRLAFEVHSKVTAQAADPLADIDEWTLQKALAELHPARNRDWAYTLIQAIKLRAGLLLERSPELYTFPHRTFQEYLAGAHLAAEGQFARLAARLAVEGAFWRQVILLAVGRLVYLSGDTDKPLALVGELCPSHPPATDQHWRKSWLAGEVLLEIGLPRVQESAFGHDLLDRVQRRLVDLLQAGALAPGERAAAGDVLAQLGDPRFDPAAWHLPATPLLGFVEIPAGPFRMGRDPAVDKNAREWEQPQHEVNLPTYYIARYPVTVAQFRAFCEATGYQPRDPDSLFGPPTRPVRSITWHEALRYCDWLTATLRAWQGTPEPLATLLRNGANGSPPWRITLPSEAEWEKAARGVDGRIYPWGNRPDRTTANYEDTGINDTSAVGAFPAGASPSGCLDMAGNVWEWTRSLWGKDWQKPTFKYPYDPGDGRENLASEAEILRVLRGGSWVDSADAVGCGFRLRLDPFDWGGDIGFRVVASPSTSGL